MDCHSFPNDIAPDVDICLGFNTDGTRPSDETINAVTGMFQVEGYEVAHNRPYGNAIAPLGYRGHSLMIEVNKRLYMDEDTLEKTEGFQIIHGQILDLYEKLLNRERLR